VLALITTPQIEATKLRSKIGKGLGQHYFGEPAWPNDLLYIFPVCILGTIAWSLGMGSLSTTAIGESSDPFSTPLEILPEWYFFPTFNLLRVIPNKLVGVLSMAGVPIGLITLPFFETLTGFHNPIRRPLGTLLYIIGTFSAIWIGFGASSTITQALSIGLL
jgi:cytochrome b6-f complex subunit 4